MGQPSLSIAKTSLPPSGAQVGAGQSITYFLAIGNAGRTPAYDIRISDTLPAGIVYQTASLTAVFTRNCSPGVGTSLGGDRCSDV